MTDVLRGAGGLPLEGGSLCTGCEELRVWPVGGESDEDDFDKTAEGGYERFG